MLVKQRETLPRRRFGKVILVKLFHPLSRDNQIYLNVGFKKPKSPLPGYHRPFKFFILRGHSFLSLCLFQTKMRFSHPYFRPDPKFDVRRISYQTVSATSSFLYLTVFLSTFNKASNCPTCFYPISFHVSLNPSNIFLRKKGAAQTCKAYVEEC